MEDTTVTITPGAEKTIGRMLQRVSDLEYAYGRGSEEHVRAAESLATSLAQVLRLGGRITRDDDLALFGASFIAYGVIPYARNRDSAPLAVEWSVHS